MDCTINFWIPLSLATTCISSCAFDTSRTITAWVQLETIKDWVHCSTSSIVLYHNCCSQTTVVRYWWLFCRRHFRDTSLGSGTDTPKVVRLPWELWYWRRQLRKRKKSWLNLMSSWTKQKTPRELLAQNMPVAVTMLQTATMHKNRDSRHFPPKSYQPCSSYPCS